ncbi:MAG: amidohydrolase family protein, partial [Gammaproteobacteria bacterium]|nr:amidohydrolase family protein [Gammaproteobacteria bacterium]
WSPEHVRNLAIGYDHSRIYPRPDQIPRMAQMNIQASIGPKYLESNGSGEGLVELYGREIVDEWQVPTRSLVEGGVLTAWEIDTHAITQRPGNAFYYLQLLVTRNIDGEIYGAQNRVDRLTALYTATRWAAEYVRRADTLGSIEPGKWADMVVLERDYMSIPDEEIHTANPVMVFVAGEVEYQEQ